MKNKDLMNNTQKKSIGKIITLSIAILLSITTFYPVLSLENQFDSKNDLSDLEKNRSTIFNSSFESWTDGTPDEFETNTGWLDSLYGTAHSGDHWAFSWAAGDTLTTSMLTFGTDTELRFWYAAEGGHQMDLEIKIDDILIWSHYDFTHTTYIEEVVNLSAYTGDHTISFVGMTSDFYGQMLDDVHVTTEIASYNVFNIDTGEQFVGIQEAIDDSDTLDRHTLECHAATYKENINVNKEITLQGVSMPIIDGLGATAVTISAENVIIDGFTIINASNGIICNEPGFTLKNNSIDVSGDGISFVKNNLGTVWNGDESIYIGQTSIIYNEIFAGNDGIYLEALSWGINMRGNAMMEIGAFIIHGNTIEAQHYGIDAYGLKWWGNSMEDEAILDFKGVQVTSNIITSGLGGYGDGIEWDDFYIFGKEMYDNACFILGNIQFNNNTITSSRKGIEIYDFKNFGEEMHGASSFLWNGNFEVINNTIVSQADEGLQIEYCSHFGCHMNDTSSFIMQDIIIAQNNVESLSDNSFSMYSFEEYGFYMGESASFTMGSIKINENMFTTYDENSYGLDFYDIGSFGEYMDDSTTFTMNNIEMNDNIITGGEYGCEDINLYYFGSHMTGNAIFAMNNIEICRNIISGNKTALEIDEISEIGYKLQDNASCVAGDILICDNILTSANGHALYTYEFDSYGYKLYDNSSVIIGNISINSNTVSSGVSGYGLWLDNIRYIGLDMYNDSMCTIGDIEVNDNMVNSGVCGINISDAYLVGHNLYDNAIFNSGFFSIANNTIMNCDYGLALYNEEDVTVSSNIITQCLCGIYISENDNLFYNNYFNNTINAYDVGENTWNIEKTAGLNILGYTYLGGNYWSDYTGVDLNGDGLGDTQLPFNSSGNIQNHGDYYPLVTPYLSDHVPIITNVQIDPSIQSPNQEVNISCTVTDYLAVDEVWVNITKPDSTIDSYEMFSTDENYYLTQSYAQLGTYFIYIWASNTLGNSNTSGPYELIIDALPSAFFTWVDADGVGSGTVIVRMIMVLFLMIGILIMMVCLMMRWV